MKILALELSTHHRSVAVLDGAIVRSLLVDSTGRETTNMVLVDRALVEASVKPSAIDLLVVGLGPGSYAGVRSAIAIAQGWQLARDTRLLGISTMDVLAAEAQAVGLYGEVTILIDAQRREYYSATFKISAETIQALRALEIVPMSTATFTGVVAGPELTKHIPAARNLYPSAATLARLAALRADFVTGEELEPIYLRPTTFVKATPPRARIDAIGREQST